MGVPGLSRVWRNVNLQFSFLITPKFKNIKLTKKVILDNVDNLMILDQLSVVLSYFLKPGIS